MDKTHINMAGLLQMEPISILHGLLNHDVRRLPSAMRILGYINHSTPAHLPADAKIDLNFNTPTDLPKGVARVKDPLPCPNDDVSWATLTLNETHMQIQIILKESFFEVAEAWFPMESAVQWSNPSHRVPLLCTVHHR